MKPDPTQLLSALADPTRLRTVLLLTCEQPLCVCELTFALDVSQPKMSRHLAALREAGLVADRKIANRVYYRLSTASPGWVQAVIDDLARGLADAPEFAADRRRLAAMPDRVDVRSLLAEGAGCCEMELEDAD